MGNPACSIDQYQNTEVNFDGLVGPTHNYSGLAFGNLASTKNHGLVSNPKQAALQGLDKMRKLHELGIRQAILAPQPRPALNLLRNFYTSPWTETPFTPLESGLDDRNLIKLTKELNPHLLSAFSSAACMWTANAATISPSSDCLDSKVHISTANLKSGLHRSIESIYTHELLQQIFANKQYFSVHPPLTVGGDEGAANHCRISSRHNSTGIEMFVYGHSSNSKSSKLFPSRQSLEASKQIAESHLLNPDYCIFAQQNPDAIDAGVFHNDVISTSNLNVFLYHELAFADTRQTINELETKWSILNPDEELYLIEASSQDLPLSDAVSSYLYNSQIISINSSEMLLIAPLEAKENNNSRNHIQKILQGNNPIKSVIYMDLRESMRNGGGPACLRLRVVLTEEEFRSIKPSVNFSEKVYNQLVNCINNTYRDHLEPSDLGDFDFIIEAEHARQEIYKILNLEDKYKLFQNP